MIKRILAAVTLALSASCSYAAEEPITVQGMYVWGEGVETFQPCNDPSVFWLNGDEASLQPLRQLAAEVMKKKHQPYQPIYVVLQVTEDVPQGEFAEDYDGVYRLSKVESFSAQIPKGCERQQVY
ncbi:Predicted membrane protein [Plesiomonas shigelloides]|uniref:hypothetical protein n=1 Tax=Plesiomonas shigelloides TaxID=703 RepID=UPI0007EDCDAC|nr:hypothetical protein [Plesiomonas shigelloides]SBT61797.1 Predicted membrane protein [Plesiomonas shigelloides]